MNFKLLQSRADYINIKYKNEATSLYICDEHGYGTNAMHNGAFSIA